MTARKEVRDVADELRRVAVAAGDGGGHFAAMYGGMTDRVAARIDAGAFDDGRRLLVFQHLLLGIEAHVNFDLPQVLVSVADREGDLAAARQDFDAINDMLVSRQRMVVSRPDGPVGERRRRPRRWPPHGPRARS